MPSALFGKSWNMNRGASTFAAGSAPDTETRKYEEIPNGYTLTVSGQLNGRPYSWGYTALYDGQPHSVTGRDDVDAITAYRVDDYVTLGIFSKVGIDGGSYSRRVSVDGRSLEVIAAGRAADGSPYFDVIHYTS
jgi:hypothetical protein